MYEESNSVDLPACVLALWAKTGRGEQSHLWESLPVHLGDTSEVARLIWREWLPEASRRFICTGTSLAPDEAESLVFWLAYVHDIGKATPSFQSKVAERGESVRESGLGLPAKCENMSHAFMGQVIFQDWLEQHEWVEGPASGLASIVGSHHGAGPSSEKQLDDIRIRSAIAPNKALGGEDWVAVQRELLDIAYDESGVGAFIDAIRERGLNPYVQIQLTGLVIMADWIASNADLFPLTSGVAKRADCYARARNGWDALGLPNPMSLIEQQDDAEGLFHRRFVGLPRTAALHPVQYEAVLRASQLEEPGLLIIEAPMGCGKTEAALLCAEVFAYKFGDGGLAYLLPTQATSNAMFSRVESWLKCLLEDQPQNAWQDLHLLHGKAELNEDYARLQHWNSSWMGDRPGEGDAIISHQWFSGRKRGLLAPVVVGTVDQLLMAALRVKHAHLRHFGLAGKVVVIDEVHAYDVYMNVYLDRMLAFLGVYGVPVILLSATLPPSRRSALMRAYAGVDKRDSRRRVVVATPPRASSGDPAYPLVTTKSRQRRDKPVFSACESDNRQRYVHIDFMPESDAALLKGLRDLLEEGGCVCVLRNTVVRAQATFALLSKELDADICLIHARFIAADRAKKDSELVSLLGPGSSKRPNKLVVVATQVVEQSIDIDFDLLITDVAPVDLMLQRMGRLHRHARGEGECDRPPMLREARCIVTGVPSWEDSPPVFAPGIDAVYQPSVLWKTIRAIKDRMNADGCLMLPADIAPLVEDVYENRTVIPDGWKDAVEHAECSMEREIELRRNAARAWLLPKPCRFNLNGWMRERVNVDDEVFGRAAVRDTDGSIEVVVVQRGRTGYEVLPWVADSFGVRASLGSGEMVPEDESARAAALCSVSLPPRLCAPWCREKVIEALEAKGMFDGWQESRWLAGVLPLVVDIDGYAEIEWEGRGFVVRYSRTTGLSVIEERRG